MSPLIIVGASARAAAASAIRAGFFPWCADLFADADLREMVAGAIRCPLETYPKAFLELLRQSPDSAWMYTGALENHPGLIRKMAAIRPLWGNGPEAMQACRSPFYVQEILCEAGLPSLKVRGSDAPLPNHCRWLSKPFAGSAGQGIAFADAATERKPTLCFQQYKPGRPMSAAYVGVDGDVKLLGVTEQLIGESWLNAPAFRYAGNIGPIDIYGDLRNELERIGSVLGGQCNLLGLFGVDFILAEGRPWVVEVNPRYTASIEVIELATGTAAIADHARAFGGTAANSCGNKWGPVVGKAILYAERSHVFHGLPEIPEPNLRFADVPAVGSAIEAGWPILSILVRGSSRDECQALLRLHVARLRADGTE
jgi:uncharacterized protein